MRRTQRIALVLVIMLGVAVQARGQVSPGTVAGEKLVINPTTVGDLNATAVARIIGVGARTPGQDLVGFSGNDLVRGLLSHADIPPEYPRRDIPESIASVWTFGPDHLRAGNGTSTGLVSADGGFASSKGLVFYDGGSYAGQLVVNSGNQFLDGAGVFSIRDVAGTTRATVSPSGLITGMDGLQATNVVPALLLHESDAGFDEKYWRLKADNDTLTLQLVSDALTSTTDIFNITRTAMLATDFRWGQNLTTVRAQNNGVTDLGTDLVRYRSLWVNELIATTFTSDETIIRSGGSEVVVEGSLLTRDLPSGSTCFFVKHNSFRAGDIVHMHKVTSTGWQDEKIVVGGGYIDCSVAGNCPAGVGEDYAYCSLTRAYDGTMANDWIIGDTIANEGQVGDGWLELTARRSAQGIGYVGQVVSDGPVLYWRMNETSSGLTQDIMSATNIFEVGTQSSGLGVVSCLIGPAGCVGPYDPVWQNNNPSATGYLTQTSFAAAQIVGDLTLEWIQIMDALPSAGTAYAVLSKHYEGEWHTQIQDSGALTFCQDIPPAGTTTYQCVSTAAGFVPVGGPHHFAVVRDMQSTPHRILFYANGVLGHTANLSDSSTPSTTTQNIAIGANHFHGALNTFFGAIDEVAIYNYQVPENRLAIHSAARQSASLSRWTRGPSVYGWVRTGSGPFDVAMRWACGNLAGSDYATSSTTAIYGCGFGNTAASWIGIDATNGVRGMFGNTLKFGITQSGVATFVEGAITIDNNGIRILNTSSVTGENKAYTFIGALSYLKRPGLFYAESGNGALTLSAGDRSSGASNLSLVAEVGTVGISAATNVTVAGGELNLNLGSKIVVNGNDGFNGTCSAASFTVTKGLITSC